MNESKVPPELPGEVWRGLDGDGDLLAVTESGDGHVAHIANERGEWGMIMGTAFREHVFHLWAMSERARTEQAERDARFAATLTKAAQDRADALARELAEARSDLAAFRAVSRDRL